MEILVLAINNGPRAKVQGKSLRILIESPNLAILWTSIFAPQIVDIHLIVEHLCPTTIQFYDHIQ